MSTKSFFLFSLIKKMKKAILLIFIGFVVVACKTNQLSISENKAMVENTLNHWHKAAAAN